MNGTNFTQVVLSADILSASTYDKRVEGFQNEYEQYINILLNFTGNGMGYSAITVRDLMGYLGMATSNTPTIQRAKKLLEEVVTKSNTEFWPVKVTKYELKKEEGKLGIDDEIKIYFERQELRGDAIGLIYLDVDTFKKINEVAHKENVSPAKLLEQYLFFKAFMRSVPTKDGSICMVGTISREIACAKLGMGLSRFKKFRDILHENQLIYWFPGSRYIASGYGLTNDFSAYRKLIELQNRKSVEETGSPKFTGKEINEAVKHSIHKYAEDPNFGIKF